MSILFFRLTLATIIFPEKRIGKIKKEILDTPTLFLLRRHPTEYDGPISANIIQKRSDIPIFCQTHFEHVAIYPIVSPCFRNISYVLPLQRTPINNRYRKVAPELIEKGYELNEKVTTFLTNVLNDKMGHVFAAFGNMKNANFYENPSTKKIIQDTTCPIVAIDINPLNYFWQIEIVFSEPILKRKNVREYFIAAMKE
ncbi:MAG: hypothetical protein GY864_03455 [Desulfobacterales bacterium]|nr:hypothetical protein [Desulfobacterales bacterium]